MADVKWIKLFTDVFDNRKIKQIETLPEGDAVIVIWMKLLCLAGNINDKGFVYFTEEIPYTEEMLATEFNRPLNIIRLALATFEKFKMIEIIDDIIKISSWEKYQNTEGLERIREQNRIRKQKERERKLLENVTQRDMSRDVTQQNKKEDKDKEEDKIGDKDNNKTTTTKRFKKPTIEEIETYCKERNNQINAEVFFDYYESKGWLVGKSPMKDWKAAIRQWEYREKPKQENKKKTGPFEDPFGQWS